MTPSQWIWWKVFRFRKLVNRWKIVKFIQSIGQKLKRVKHHITYRIRLVFCAYLNPYNLISLLRLVLDSRIRTRAYCVAKCCSHFPNWDPWSRSHSRTCWICIRMWLHVRIGPSFVITILGSCMCVCAHGKRAQCLPQTVGWFLCLLFRPLRCVHVCIRIARMRMDTEQSRRITLSNFCHFIVIWKEKLVQHICCVGRPNGE